MSRMQKLLTGSTQSTLLGGCRKNFPGVGSTRLPVFSGARPASTRVNEKYRMPTYVSQQQPAEKVMVWMNPRSCMKVDASWLRMKSSCSKKSQPQSQDGVSKINEAGEGDWFEVIWRDGQVSWFNKDWLRENYQK